MTQRNIYQIALLSLLTFALLCLSSCLSAPENAEKVNAAPKIYPDYTDVTIPKNIAPLNFMLRDGADAVALQINGKNVICSSGSKVVFDEDEWQDIMQRNAGKKLTVKLFAKYSETWKEYNSFSWFVANDTIDPYLTYRLIEPDYELWNKVQLQQRNITNFDTKILADYNLQENRCMNCHILGNQNPDLSMMYVRGEGGGAILNRNGKLRKLNIKASNSTDSMISGSVYYNFDKTGKYITFSTNIIIPAFHAEKSNRLEVYDTNSSVYVANLDDNIIYNIHSLADTSKLQTFPTFGPDNKSIYYCVADKKGLKDRTLRSLKYALVRTKFDIVKGCVKEHTDTLYKERSVCHPRISPDGRYIVYTVADYGTFPIWHREADLQKMELKTGKVDTMKIVNSDRSDTYHSWSSNSRWLVFASKRDDGLYGKPYFCYIDKTGKAHKPFLLPQEDPEFYDNYLKSFNVPELSKGDVPFDAIDIQRAMKKESEPFKLVNVETIPDKSDK